MFAARLPHDSHAMRTSAEGFELKWPIMHDWITQDHKKYLFMFETQYPISLTSGTETQSLYRLVASKVSFLSLMVCCNTSFAWLSR